jgi:hypothetical protein
MSNIEDRTKDILKEEIDQLIELQDQGVRLLEKKTEVVERMASKLEASGMEPDKICLTIKRILKQNYIQISDDTIERACGIDRKRKHKPYETLPVDRNPHYADFSESVTVSSDGSESYTKPDGTEGDRQYNPYEGEPEPIPSIQEVNEQATEIALSLADEYAKKAKEQEIRLREALQIADDKDKRIYQLEMEAGELEMQIADLKKKPVTTKDVDRAEELQIENDNLKVLVEELKEALRANVKASGFTQASHIPKQVWVAAINALNFYRTLNKASRHAIEHNDPWRRIIFDIAEDGQLKAAKLEGVHDGADSK